MKRLACGAILALVGGTQAIAQYPGVVGPNAGELVVSLTVSADPVKLNGSPWDGIPAIGGRILIPDASNAPDITVCVVLATGTPECIWRTERARKVSPCPDSNKCTIDGLRLPSLPVGLLIMDADLARHDLIDFVVLTGEPSVPADNEKVAANLRAVMAKLAPGGTPSERARRQRKPTILPIEKCMGVKATCDLTQSRFRLERR